MAEVAPVPCPLCANTSSFIEVRVPREDAHIRSYGALYEGMTVSQWKVCGRCGFVHQNPRPSTDALNRFYLAGEYHAKIEIPPDQLFAEHAPYYADEVDYAIARSGLSTGTVFDVGCGLGVALKIFKDRGWTCYGLEPDRGRYEYGKQAYGLDHIDHGTLNAAYESPAKADLVFTHHAFEHFADLPEVMEGITRILEPNGFLFTAIPTFRQNRSTMSKLWMNSAHYSLFTHQSFNQLLARHGFEEVGHRYDRWRSGPDQFGHLARWTGTTAAPETYYEDPKAIARYLEVVNPIRSAVFFPLIGGYRGYRHHLRAAVKAARHAGHLLRTQPDQFLAKAAAALRRK